MTSANNMPAACRPRLARIARAAFRVALLISWPFLMVGVWGPLPALFLARIRGGFEEVWLLRPPGIYLSAAAWAVLAAGLSIAVGVDEYRRRRRGAGAGAQRS